VKIQKLKIQGFKSFERKEELLFEGNGLTAIVGPNGCGKSNIVDAIRWVMGEQRAGLLRMDKMQGVIFSGTAERPAKSVAEVSLVIENDRGLLPSEYSEVMITRKAFSGGESEYLINNQECRLADIRNLFADTGMGTGSYSQMDQRMVDALLSDKADERRTIFEEAAGVSKYKKQKKEAVARLERTQIDMNSIATDLQYAKNQFRQQERMLVRAQELRKLKNRLKELDVSVSLAKYTENKITFGTLSAAKDTGKAEIEKLRIKLNELELKIEEKRLSTSSYEENLRECEIEYSDAKSEAAKQNEAYIHLRNREKEHEENKIRCENEINESENAIFSLKSEMQRLENELEIASSEIDEIEAQGKKKNEALQNLRGSVEVLRKRHRELSDKRLQFVQTEGKLKSLWQRTDAEIELLEERKQLLAKDIQNMDSKIRESELLMNDRENEIRQSENNSEILTERQRVLTNEKETLSENVDFLINRRMESIREKNILESRLEALQSIKNSKNLEGNNLLLNQEAAKEITLLSSQIEILDSKYAALVEFCLGFLVQALLTQNQEMVLACEQILNGENSGRALLAWNVPETSIGVSEGISDPDIIAPLTSLVKCSENSSILLNSLLSKYFLVKTQILIFPYFY
jgi:chromosome segregation protein